MTRKSINISFNKPSEPETTVEASLCLYSKNQDEMAQHAAEFVNKHGVDVKENRFQIFIDMSVTGDKEAFAEFDPLLKSTIDHYNEIEAASGKEHSFAVNTSYESDGCLHVQVYK